MSAQEYGQGYGHAMNFGQGRLPDPAVASSAIVIKLGIPVGAATIGR
jgi:hypothetical protein